MIKFSRGKINHGNLMITHKMWLLGQTFSQQNISKVLTIMHVLYSNIIIMCLICYNFLYNIQSCITDWWRNLDKLDCWLLWWWTLQLSHLARLQIAIMGYITLSWLILILSAFFNISAVFFATMVKTEGKLYKSASNLKVSKESYKNIIYGVYRFVKIMQ